MPNPFFNVITDGSSLLSKSTIQQGYLYRPYPQFQNVTLTNSPWGHSTYHAFQLTVEHRLSKGLSLLLGYTHSKSIDDIGESGTSSSIQDNGCHRCERSDCRPGSAECCTVEHLVPASLGPQKQFLNHGLFSQIIGGWELGGTYQYNTRSTPFAHIAATVGFSQYRCSDAPDADWCTHHDEGNECSGPAVRFQPSSV